MRNSQSNFSFSIIIPVYNAEKYIDATINSVILQSYSMWELIIIDDGSTDGSYDICKKYESDKIQVYHYENNGQMVARIEGINKADSDYTLVIDADDTLNEKCLELVNEKLKEDNIDMVFFAFRECDEDLLTGTDQLFDNDLTAMNQEEMLDYIITHWNHQLWNKVIKTGIMKKGAANATHKKLKINGDYALVIPVTCFVNNVTLLNEPLYNYRITTSSISHNYCAQHVQDIDYVSCNVIKLLNDNCSCSEKIIEHICVANCKMILMVLNELLYAHKLSSDILQSLNELKLYSETPQYGSINYLGMIDSLSLRIYRKGNMLWLPLVRMLHFMRKIKNLLGRIWYEIGCQKECKEKYCHRNCE